MNSQPSARPSNCSDEIIPFDDPIVAEVRRARREIMAEYGGDFEAMARDVIKNQYAEGHEVAPAPNAPRKTPPATDATRTNSGG